MENNGIILELYYENKHLPRPHGSHIPKRHVLPNVASRNYPLQLPVLGLFLELIYGFTLPQHDGHLRFRVDLDAETPSAFDIYPFVKVLAFRYPGLG